MGPQTSALVIDGVPMGNYDERYVWTLTLNPPSYTSSHQDAQLPTLKS